MTRPEVAPSGKRLAFVLPDMTGGGAERIALRLMEDALAAGHEVDLVLQARKGELLALLPSSVRVIDLHAARLRDVIAPMARYFRTERPDGVQIFMWPLTVLGIIAHLTSRSRARLVVSDHTIFSRHFAGLGRTGRRFLKASVKLLYPRADARILVSGGAADDLARLTGITRSSIEVIYNPVGCPAGRPATDPMIEKLWGTADGRILTVGKLKPEKNHALLIQSFARLLQSRPARLMILGDGPLRRETEQLVTSLGLADHVVLPGFANDPWPFYASADLFALTSDYEGFGNVLIEAMHCGVTAVSTDCPDGPREILGGGAYGTLVPVDDEAALAAALAAGLATPLDPQMLMDRAAALSGPDTSARYLALMLGEAPAQMQLPDLPTR